MKSQHALPVAACGAVSVQSQQVPGEAATNLETSLRELL